MTEKKIKDFRIQIKSTINKKHEETLQTMVDLADYLNGYRMFKEALTEYRIAKEYSAKLSNGNAKKAQLLYEAEYGYLQALAQLDKSRISEALNEFLLKYPVMSEELDMIKRQDASQLVANCYFEMKNYDSAREYLALSSQLLESLVQQLQPSSKDFKKKEDDYEIRKAQIYYFFIEIALAEKRFAEAKEYCDKALQCRGIEKDNEVYYFLLDIKRTYLPVTERLPISLQLHSLWVKNKKHRLKKDGLNTLYCLFRDYCALEEYDKAEQQLWLAYKEEEAIKKEGEKNLVLKDLIEWYKLRSRLQDFGKVKYENDGQICREYEKIACGFFNMKSEELAFKYFELMLQLTPADDFSKRKTILESLVKCLDGFARSHDDLVQAFKYCDELCDISKNLNSTDLIQKQLDRAIAMAKLDICSFDEKKQALMEVKKELKDDEEFVKFYTASSTLLKENESPDTAAAAEGAQVKEKLKFYQEQIKDAKKPDNINIVPTTTDEYDELSNEEIFKTMEEKWTKYEKIEALKKKMNEKDNYGFTQLHKAVKKKNFDEIKFMLEECGYISTINEQDGGGRTALFQAVMDEENVIAELLIKHGASPDIATTDKGSKDPAGRTALMEAASLRNTSLIRLLLNNDANPLLKDHSGKLASDYLKDKLRLCHVALNNRGCPKFEKKEKEEIAKTITQAEYDKLKETKKLLKKAVKEREKKNKENRGENVKAEIKTEDENGGERSNSRKRSSSEVLCVAKRSKSN